MTMPLYERVVNLCSINLQFEDQKCAEQYSIKKAIENIKQKADTQGIQKVYDKETVLMKLSEVQINDTYACFLISKIDKEVADVVYSDIETLQRREIKKKDNEGNTICCHVLISLTPTSPVNLTYSCVVERMFGIGLISDVGRFLKYIFKEYGIKKNGKSFFPKLLLIGRECSSIKDTLSKAILSRVKFSTKKEYAQGIDQLNYCAIDEKSIILKAKTTGKQAIDFLTNVLTLHKSSYSYVSITVIDDGQQKTNEVELDEENDTEVTEKRDINDILGQAFFKPEKLSGFETKLEVAYEAIRKDLLEKMSHFL